MIRGSLLPRAPCARICGKYATATSTPKANNLKRPTSLFLNYPVDGANNARAYSTFPKDIHEKKKNVAEFNHITNYRELSSSNETDELMNSERESMPFDVLIVGGGPAGLAASIRIKQLCIEKDMDLSVCVVEKGRCVD